MLPNNSININTHRIDRKLSKSTMLFRLKSSVMKNKVNKYSDKERREERMIYYERTDVNNKEERRLKITRAINGKETSERARIVISDSE